MDELDPDGDAPDEPAPAIDSTALMRVISEYLGAPYKHGGESGEGMDCSAFTRSVFEKAFSIDLPRSTDRQYATGRKIRRKNIARGDLVFFNTTGHIPSHVGIYIGEGMFAHASVNEGVTLSSLASRYYARRYTGARRILK
jgi:cell wall-associated NlpC family hydrolase